jgi:TRAP-type C4-dicarboxylate transport system substrate-binding protein
MMKRLSVLLSVFLFVAFALPGQSLAAEAEFTLRIGSVAPKGTPWYKLLRRAKKRIQKDSGGRIKVKLYVGGRLGSENAIVRRCRKGQVGGIAVSNGAIASSVRELEATELPYLFATPRQADRALEAAKPIVSRLFQQKGFVFYMWGENGYRHFASKKRFFVKPSDLKGAKMRSQPAKPHIWMYQALGASAQTLPVSEVTTSLANGVVNGYDNTLLYSYATQWYKQIKYITMTGHIYQPAVVAWCKKWFDKLPADLQKVVMTRPAGEEAWGRRMVRAMNKLLRGKFKAEGKEVKFLSGSQKAAFKRATASVEGKFKRSTSAMGRQLLQVLKSNR